MTTYYNRLKKQWENEGMVKGKEEGRAESESKLNDRKFSYKKSCEKYCDFSQPLFL